MEDFDATLERYHDSLDTIVKGDAEAIKALWSNRDDVTLSNPWGPSVRGWGQAASRMESAATNFKDGRAIAFENLATHAGGDLICTVEVEKFEVKIGGRPDLTEFTLRVTSIFRREDGAWKVIHRHADPISAPRTADQLLKSL